MFKLGLVVNPLAGIGGPLALKGSDGSDVVELALHSGARLRASHRAAEALKELSAYKGVQLYSFAGAMGAEAAELAGLTTTVIGCARHQQTTAQDTMTAASALKALEVDLILFAGGDGTARDIYRAVGDSCPVLGVPAGVKMHSGVYAVSPQAAGEILRRLINGQLVDVGLAEVRDIDEPAFREGVVRSRYYGELLVPREGHFLQQVKSSGREVEELVLQDIAADIVESMEDDELYLIGPGTTPRGIMDELGLDNSLLGIDAVVAGKLVGQDLSERALLQLLQRHSGPAKIIITAIGGQGHILGRGNQQLSPAVIRMVGSDNIILVATKTKIAELEGRPLLVDSGDAALDEEMSAYRQVITGYHDAILYPVGLHTGESK